MTGKLLGTFSVLIALSVSVGWQQQACAGHTNFVHRLAASGKADTVKVRDKWALLIGVDRFQDPQVVPNKAAANNIRVLKTLLESPAAGRFSPDHVHVLSGERATASGINQALNEWLVKKALPDDLIFIYVSSVVDHNAQGDAMAFSFDTLGSETDLSGINLREFLSDVRKRTQSHYILCALDTSPAPGTEGANLKELAKSGVTILSATEGKQKSLNNGVTGGSVFVHHLGEAMSLQGGHLTLEQIYDHLLQTIVSDAANAFHTEQTPTLTLGSDATIVQVPLGAPSRSSVSAQNFSIGHPMDRLALDHPNIIAPHDNPAPERHTQAGGPSPKTKPVAAKKQNDDDDDDDAPRKEVDFSSYMSKMKADIQKRWVPPKGLDNRRIVAVFTIMKDGRLIDAHIVEGSGVADVDKSALDALKAASPLDPLPPGSPASVDIKYKFDWQVKRD